MKIGLTPDAPAETFRKTVYIKRHNKALVFRKSAAGVIGNAVSENGLHKIRSQKTVFPKPGPMAAFWSGGRLCQAGEKVATGDFWKITRFLLHLRGAFFRNSCRRKMCRRFSENHLLFIAFAQGVFPNHQRLRQRLRRTRSITPLTFVTISDRSSGHSPRAQVLC